MPGKRAARHARSAGAWQGLRPLAVAATVVVAAVAAALVIYLNGIGSGDPDGSSPTSSDAATKPRRSPGTSTSADGSPASPRQDSGTSTGGTTAAGWLRACVADASRADRAVEAAAGGVSRWRQHVQARTDMLAGRISEKRMQAVWDRTQDAGPADQRHFHAALHPYDGHRHCAQPRAVDAAHTTQAAGCLARTGLLARAVRDARGAMRDWEVHLANMARFAHHRMSAALAQGKWVKAWRNAPKNISAYRHTRSALATAPSCGGSGNG